MNDEDLIKDMERATRRLDDSLKVCRKIISSYRTSLASLAEKNAEEEKALFDWPDRRPEAPMESAPPGDDVKSEAGTAQPRERPKETVSTARPGSENP